MLDKKNLKKALGAAFVCAILASMTACGNSEDAIGVTPKDAASESERTEVLSEEMADAQAGSGAQGAETLQEDSGALRASLEAPEHCTAEAADESGKFRVEIDADVFIPAVDAMPTMDVTEMVVDDAFVKRFTDTFLAGAVFYKDEDYYQMTSADIEERIAELEERLEAGDFNPEEFGLEPGDELTEEEYRAQLEEAIKAWEENKKKAPETVVCEPVTPGISGPNESTNYYTALLGDAEYSFQAGDFCGYHLKAQKNQEDGNLLWTEYYSSSEETFSLSEEEINAIVGIDYEAAAAVAREKAAAMGLGDFEIAIGKFMYLADPDGERNKEAIQRGAYNFHFVRKVNGAPITYTIEAGGGLPDDTDTYMDTWNYECLDVLVSKDGIEAAEFACPYEIKEGSGKETQLLSFDKIMDIFKEMMLVEMGELSGYENWRTYHIDRITLGYSRIYNPTVSASEGTLVPVWDFFGSFECESDWNGEKVANKSTVDTQSYLTINAIDGSLIVRGLGY